MHIDMGCIIHWSGIGAVGNKLAGLALAIKITACDLCQRSQLNGTGWRKKNPASDYGDVADSSEATRQLGRTNGAQQAFTCVYKGHT